MGRERRCDLTCAACASCSPSATAHGPARPSRRRGGVGARERARCRPASSPSERGLPGERRPCDAAVLHSPPWSGGCWRTPGPHTGGPSSDASSTTRAEPVRRRTGHLRSPKKPGDLYIVEFSLNGERHYVSLPDSAGWDRVRAERERAYLMEKVNRGEWRAGAPAGPAAARG